MIAQEAMRAARSQMVPATSPQDPFDAELRFTEVYRQYEHAHPAIREAMCLRVQVPDLLCPIEDGDLIAGRIQPRLVGFSPDEYGSCAFGYYHLPAAIAAALESLPLDSRQRRRVLEMLRFWNDENTSTRVRRRYSEATATALPSDDWMNQPGIAFPLYRLTGGNVNYRRLLQLGIPGLSQAIEQQRGRASADGGATALYDGMLIALDALADACRMYGRGAGEYHDGAAAESARGDPALLALLARRRYSQPRAHGCLSRPVSGARS
jgi:hypothetical protein